MKKHFNYIVICSLLIAAGCKQDVITLQEPEAQTPETPSKGNADFTKYVAIGNSLTAGFQAGALFTEGQQNSFPCHSQQWLTGVSRVVACCRKFFPPHHYHSLLVARSKDREHVRQSHQHPRG